jgi:hypothetical protein
MATTAVASATVEPATAAAVESRVAVESAAFATADEAVRVAAASIITAVSVVSAAAIVTATTVEAMAITAVEPGAGADEDTTGEVVRPVITVRSAGVRSVTVVTVGADRRRADCTVDGAYPDAHPNLRVGAARGKK